MKKSYEEIYAENRALWAEVAESEQLYENECSRINGRIIKAIENQLGEQFMLDVAECFQESEAKGAMELVRKPEGEWQEEDYASFRGIWVDQGSVGDSGDSWEGVVCIRVKRGLWLKMFYSM